MPLKPPLALGRVSGGLYAVQYPTVGYMVVPVCSVQTVGLYKSCGCICDITISTALYPPLFMSVGYLQQHLHPLYM